MAIVDSLLFDARYGARVRVDRRALLCLFNLRNEGPRSSSFGRGNRCDAIYQYHHYQSAVSLFWWSKLIRCLGANRCGLAEKSTCA